MNAKNNILIAGVGNELRQDDAFGVEFIRSWSRDVTSYPHINIMEVGIAGIHLVQQLQEGYDMLILVDAVDYQRAPGTISIEKLESISDIHEFPLDKKREFLADMHYTNPMRAMMLAKAIDILPDEVYILGCQSAQHDDFALGMSDEVKSAIPKAIERLSSWLQLGAAHQNLEKIQDQ